MPGEDVLPPEPIAAMLAQLEEETAHMTPQYLAGKLAEVEAAVAAMPVEERIRRERRAEIAALTAEANRLLAADPAIVALDAAMTPPPSDRLCGGCGKPWPCPDAPLTDREQDRLDEWRMDQEADRD